MKKNVADYIVEFLIEKGVSDVFGYQGGMITYLFDAFDRHKDQIAYHTCYNEQGAAFMANGYAQATGKLGFAFVTSGPGFTNLLTGIANAWFDSIPTMYVTAQVNYKDKRHGAAYRQKGFQEIDSIDMAKPIVKKAYDIDFGTQMVENMEDAYHQAMSSRRGPVVLEIPINVFRDEIEVPDGSCSLIEDDAGNEKYQSVLNAVSMAKRPLILAGAGIRQTETRDLFRLFVEKAKIPVVTTLPGIDVLPSDSPYCFGYIGASGKRLPNLLLKECDLVVSLGSRLATRQVGHHLELFAPGAKLVRLDVDDSEFTKKIKEDEIQIHTSLAPFFRYAVDHVQPIENRQWLSQSQAARSLLMPFDKSEGNLIFENITRLLPENANIVLDVGKNEIWGAQSSQIKAGTRLYLSAGLGSMGYGLPAGIGAYHGNHHPTFVFAGDGGIQMNIQEFQTISVDKLPLKVFVLNNRALGMITLFQDQYFDSRYVADKDRIGGYHSANVVDIAQAYGIKGVHLSDKTDVQNHLKELTSSKPVVFEIGIANEDEPILPGIPAGSDPLTSGEPLPESVILQIQKIFSE